MIYVLIVLDVLLMSTSALASSCYSIRDYDRRLECLARERGSPATCESIKNWDARQWCRERSRGGR